MGISRRTIVIGDVHGCYTELLDLLDSLQVIDQDRVIFVGDFLDKGPESVRCMHLARTLGFESVLGNHEWKYMRYRRHQERVESDPRYKNPMDLKDEAREIYEALLPEDFEWMWSLPMSLEALPGVHVLHAGLLPSEDPRKPSENVLRLRWVIDGKEKAQPLSESGDLWNPPVGSSWWTQRYLGQGTLVYGHASRSFAGPFVEQAPGGARTYGIDTGCVYGGKLTAAIFETEHPEVPPRFEAVAARARYHELPPGGPS